MKNVGEDSFTLQVIAVPNTTSAEILTHADYIIIMSKCQGRKYYPTKISMSAYKNVNFFHFVT